jgi:hypothetical protein
LRRNSNPLFSAERTAKLEVAVASNLFNFFNLAQLSRRPVVVLVHGNRFST